MSRDLTPSLVVALRSGDATAGRLLEELYRALLVRFARGYLPADEVEDAVQDVFLKVLAAEQVPENFRAWLYRLARNHFLNLMRSGSRRRGGEPLPEVDLPASLHGELTHLGERERRARLHERLAALPEGHREALLLRYVENLSRAEIAQVLDAGVGRVKTWLFEALQRMRRHRSLADG